MNGEGVAAQPALTRHDLLVGGQLQAAAAGRRYRVTSPATVYPSRLTTTTRVGCAKLGSLAALCARADGMPPIDSRNRAVAHVILPVAVIPKHECSAPRA